MRRTHLSLCVATAGLLLLTACGADNENDDNENDDAGEPTGATETTTVAPEPEDDNEDEEAAETETFATAELADVAGNPIGTATAAETEDGVRLTADVQSLNPGFRAIAIHENGACEVQSADESGQIGDFYSAGEVLLGEAQDDPGVVEGEDELADPEGEEDAEGEQPEGEDPNASAEFTFDLAGQPAGQGAPPAPPQPVEDEEETPRAERAGALPNLLVGEDGTGYLEVISGRLSEELLLDDDSTAVLVYTGTDHHGNIPERYAPFGPDAGSLATGDAGQRYACGVLESDQ